MPIGPDYVFWLGLRGPAIVAGTNPFFSLAAMEKRDGFLGIVDLDRNRGTRVLAVHAGRLTGIRWRG